MVIRWSRVVASLLAAAATGAVTGAAWASDERAVQPVWAPPAACPISADHVIANGGLQRSRAAIADRRLVILAVGSSSIEGVGASRPDLGFVPRLDAALKDYEPPKTPLIDLSFVGDLFRFLGREVDRELSREGPRSTCDRCGCRRASRCGC